MKSFLWFILYFKYRHGYLLFSVVSLEEPFLFLGTWSYFLWPSNDLYIIDSTSSVFNLTLAFYPSHKEFKWSKFLLNLKKSSMPPCSSYSVSVSLSDTHFSIYLACISIDTLKELSLRSEIMSIAWNLKIYFISHIIWLYSFILHIW